MSDQEKPLPCPYPGCGREPRPLEHGKRFGCNWNRHLIACESQHAWNAFVRRFKPEPKGEVVRVKMNMEFHKDFGRIWISGSGQSPWPEDVPLPGFNDHIHINIPIPEPVEDCDEQSSVAKNRPDVRGR